MLHPKNLTTFTAWQAFFEGKNKSLFCRKHNIPRTLLANALSRKAISDRTKQLIDAAIAKEKTELATINQIVKSELDHE